MKTVKFITAICSGDAGFSTRNDCIMVQMRTPMRVNRFDAKPVPLCTTCRKAMKGQWRYY